VRSRFAKLVNVGLLPSREKVCRRPDEGRGTSLTDDGPEHKNTIP